MFDDTFLDIVQSEMVFVKDALCAGEIEIVFCVFVPRNAYKGMHIIDLHLVVGRMAGHRLQLVDFLVYGFFYLVVPLLFFGGFPDFVNVLFLDISSQFVLDGLHLLLQEIFPLLLVYVLHSLVLYGGFYFKHLGFFGKHLQ